MTEVAALDLGGSHVSAARVDLDARATVPGTATRISFGPDARGAELLEAIVGAAAAAAGAVDVLGFAAPGPFDYERGICKVQGLAKLEALYDVDVRSELASALGSDTRTFFLNDAEAFVLGEGWAGAARGRPRVVGITLGTGLGSGFLAEGRIVAEGPSVPPDGSLHLVPFRGGSVEDVISARGLLRRYPTPFDGVAELATAARGGDPSAVRLFEELGDDLGEFLAPWLESFGANALVVGGSIARAWELFGTRLERSLADVQGLELVAPAARIDDAPLLGAALHAAARSGVGP